MEPRRLFIPHFLKPKESEGSIIGLSSGLGIENTDQKIQINPLDALPIIIVDPGTPMTALVYAENTITYGDHKRFSSYAEHNFLTKLLILQPGDIFAVEYSTWTNRWGFGDKKSAEQAKKVSEPKLVIRKLPFMMNRDWSYNDWLADYLPVEK